MTEVPRTTARALTGSLPADWIDSWGNPPPFHARQQADIRGAIEALAADVPFTDRSSQLQSLVGSAHIRDFPVHRWYFYKEGFSPYLPPLLVKLLGATTERLVVADPFAGVATTPLALTSHSNVEAAIGIEYSPFAAFVGHVKLSAADLQPDRIARHILRLQEFPQAKIQPEIPSLSSFRNPNIFSPPVLQQILKARDVIRSDQLLTDQERAFFLLGIAAVIEDLSNVMKDGRALRILHGRKRRRQGLQPAVNPRTDNGVSSVLVNQWNGMYEDILRVTSAHRRSNCARTSQLRGDARDLTSLHGPDGSIGLADDTVSFHIYSPPYLNFLDYTEVYKLELWLLEFVVDESGFRELREGTLRSHPSIQFPPRPSPSAQSKVLSVIDDLSSYLVRHLARPPIGLTVKYYFEDMHAALREQYRTLRPGGAVACVVANSILSRRNKTADSSTEIWRVPILTDVFLARLAEEIGFVDVELWGARALQAKNVHAGAARESVVVARKPT